MRIRRSRCILVSILVANIIVLYFFWKQNKYLDRSDVSNEVQNENSEIEELNDKKTHAVNKYRDISEDVTVIFREFEMFENDLTNTVISVLGKLPQIKIYIVSDGILYPPLGIPPIKNIKVLQLEPQVEDPPFMSRPDVYIKTRFVMLVPDSVRIPNPHIIDLMRQKILTRYPKHIIALRVKGESSLCNILDVKLKEWTLHYKNQSSYADVCDSLQGKHVLLMKSSQFLNLSHPYARPFPESLFIQSALRNWKIHIIGNVSADPGKDLFTDSHNQWKKASQHQERLKSTFSKFGIKKVILPSGSTQWHGCTKNSQRCFGTVVNDMPDYLFKNRWTPPCCLEAVRKTAVHVFRTLNQCGARFWLEGGSLLGAARSRDIIPWDYDVDLGIYLDDIDQCYWLKKARENQIVDDDGFIWEKATEGDFYRVQYSATNHMHVDIFPFYSKNGIMTKNTWFKTHRQDREFPEHFLRPLTTIHFVGVEAPAPNNIRDFLELKFGEGVIENPQYPDPKLMKFPKTDWGLKGP